MAKQPHHDDDQAKKPNGDQPKTSKPVVPNMSLDEPIEEEPLEVEEVFEEDVPIVEAAPAEEEFILGDADVVEEDVAEAVPVDDADEEIFAAEIDEAAEVAPLVAAAPVVEAAPIAEAPNSDVDLMQMFDEEPALEPIAAAVPPMAHTPSFADKLATASAPMEDAVVEEIAEAAPASDVKSAEAVFDDSLTQAIPASGAHPKDAIFDDAMTQPVPASSDVVASEKIAPSSDLRTAEDLGEPTSAVAPVSDVVEADEAVEEASAVSEAEEVVEEAASAVTEAEEVAEAAPTSDVLFDEEIAEAAPASEAKSAEIAEEAAEAMDEPSSATRKAEAVLDDEIAEAEAASSGSVIEEAVAEEEVFDAEEAEAVGTGSSGVLSDVAVEPSSAVKKPASGAGKTMDFDKTVAFSSPSSAAKKVDDDALVTEEEMVGSSEASSVDLGEMPPRKGSSVKGIDKVAEALESGLDIGGDSAEEEGKLAKTVPSVEFDELLDEIDDAEEVPAKPTKGKKPSTKKDEELATELDADAIDEAVEAKSTGDDIDLGELFDEGEAVEAAEDAEEAEAAEAFDDETEAAEAFDAEDAEAEAAEAFDEEEAEAAEAIDEEETAAAVDEAEAAEAFDEDDEMPRAVKAAKRGKKVRDEEEDEDAEEEVSPKKKKGKKDKATLAPAPAQKSGFLRIVIGMFLATILIAGGAGAAWWFVPDKIKEYADMSENVTKIPPPKPHEPTVLEKAHEAMDQGKFQEAAEILKDASAPAELGARGEARWFAYAKDNAAPDGDNPKVKEAIDDLKKGNHDVLLKQVEKTLEQKTVRDDLAKAITEKAELDKMLTATAAEKVAAEKRLEAAKQVLITGNFIKKDADFDAIVLQKLLKSLSDDRAKLETVNEILADAKIKGTDEEGVKEVLKIKKGLEDNIAAVNKVLKDADVKDMGDKGVSEVVKARNEFMKDRDELLNTLSAAFKELVDGKIVKDGADPRKEIVAGTKVARQKAESPLAIPLGQLSMSLGNVGSGTGKVVEKSFDMAKVFSELGYFRTREPFVQTPEQKMNTYITLLQDRKRNNPKELTDISREADWVRSPDSKADKDARAKARYVQGLALRNQEKFAEAKTAFDETLKMIPKAGSWSELAQKSHNELIDPRAYYLPRIDRFHAEGNNKAALDEANLALKAIPANAHLFAQRGLIRFELVRGKGSKIPEAAQKEIRADAASAGKDEKLAGESAYIVGLLEEELGNWTEAEKFYRQAIKTDTGMDDNAGKYRVALARLLLRDRPDVVPAIPAPAPADEDKKKKDDKDGAALQERTIDLHPWSLLIVSTVMAQVPFDEVEDKETLARLNETLKLAEELIASKNLKIQGQGYLLKGSALSKLGKRTEGLKEYSNGLKLIYPGIETKEMNELIADHPAFQQPDTSNIPNPIMAERHFGEGMHFYWTKQYPQAEAQFRQAVKYYDKDARYQYYLGLSQLLQKTKLKRDAAIFSFETGARLEAKMASTNPDAVREINASLERVQGELRQYLNGHRYKAKSGEPEAK
jgi:hypothetical protein